MKKIAIINIILFICIATDARFQVKEIPGYGKSIPGLSPIEVTLNDRTACLNGDPSGEQPPTRGDTTVQVDKLILEMVEMGFDAYIIPSEDSHQSEYPSLADERRGYMSGMTGSAGTAVVLSDGRRALWTDSRYHLQADDEMDCSWLLMKSGITGVPTISGWIVESLPIGSVVASDSRLIITNAWKSFKKDFTSADLSFVVEEVNDGNNIVDKVWNENGRPLYSLAEAFVHTIEFAGKSWQDKVNDVATEMSTDGVEALVIASLDETAWLLNLRGSDIEYNPFFRSYVTIDIIGGIPPNVNLYVPDADIKLNANVRKHLSIGQCNPTDPCVRLGDYDSIGEAVSSIGLISERVWIPNRLSYYIYSQVDEEKIESSTSPVMLMKAKKNDVELEGMRNAHIRDALAVIELLANLETDISNGIWWRELDVSAEAEKYRLEMEDSMGSSFEAISAFGPNAAVVHYAPTEESNYEITDQNVYLLDSGGQYFDGTTDITRTMHFGTPIPYQIETYTLVLQGVIDFASAIFPVGTDGGYIDVLARQHLFGVGLNFGHGVSHGIGAFGGVHEDRTSEFEYGFTVSDEPGYYEDGQFGIRIENVVIVTEAETKYDYTPESFQFETITLVPYEPKLIDLSLLTMVQCNWLNEYNARIRNVVGPELLKVGYIKGHEWMLSKTEPVNC